MKISRPIAAVVSLLAAIPLFGAGNGLKGDYFANTGMIGSPVASRTDATVNFNWSGAPVAGISSNYFSVRWSGKVEAPVTGAYKLATYSNEGVRVWLSGTLIIDHWNAHSLERDAANPVNLTAGQKYDLKIEFYDRSGAANARLLWSYPGQAEVAVPQARLYSDAATVLTPPVYLSELTPTVSISGWGPYEKDRSNGESRARDGQTLSLGNVKWGRGLGVHPASDLRYQLAGKYQTFYAELGVDDEVNDRGTVIFEVWLDGAMKYRSPVVKGYEKAVPISIPVAGGNELKLIVTDGGDGSGYDHADWAGARLVNQPTTTPPPPTPTPVSPPATPTGLMTTPGNATVAAKWNAVTGAASYKLFRSSVSGQQGIQIGGTLLGTTFNDTGLTNGTTYLYSVLATNSAGSSLPSAQVSAKPVAPPKPPPAPASLSATGGNAKVTLTWAVAEGAASYNVYRSTTSGGQTTPMQMAIAGTTFTDTTVTNGTNYYYKVAGVNAVGTGAMSPQASAKPVAPPPPPAPTGLSAAPGDTKVTLTWTASADAASYNLYRATTSGGQGTTPVKTGITGTTYTDTGLANNTTVYYKVAAVNANGTSNMSNQASAKPVPPPPPTAPTGFSATPADSKITVSWNTVAGATSYNLFRAIKSGQQGDTPVQTGLTGVTFTDMGLINGTAYFYKVAAVSPSGQGSKSPEVSATPTPLPIVLSAQQKAAFKFLRQATWGPTKALVDHVVQVGKPAFLDEQFALPPTPYPDELITKPNMELVSEQFFQNAMQGPDQLRQRVAWALSQVWVASAIKVDNTHAMVPYIRVLEEGAFGNVRDVLEKVTLTPAMGEFLDMVNNKKADTVKGTMPNENYARELMQLFTIGLTELNPDGSTNGVATYGQADILDMARVLSGWTYGDAVAGDPSKLNPRYYDGPMEPVAIHHDVGSKKVLGATFLAGQTARADLKQALDLLFNHKNMGPFLVKQLIQRLVKSNPSPAYISDVVGVFNNNGQGVRGDLKAIVRAILLHPEAAATPDSGKFSEPALFLTTFARGLNSTVVDHPYFTDFSENMGERIWFAPSVFSYFSPGYRLNGVLGPELQIWSTATAMTRTNWVASLVSGGFGTNFTIDTTPYVPYGGNPSALVDTANALLMGGSMGPEMKASILTALQAATSNTDRIRTVLYLIGSSMQYQVEH